MFEQVLEGCRAELSRSEFEEAMEEGRALTMEQAIAFAFEKSNG
jgi:hypothetical protein